MSLIGFKCPKSGKNIRFEDCLKEGGCSDRCMSRSSLTLMSRVRKWTGTPSTTQLINGTMLEFLKLTNDYYENPLDMTFRVMGTKAHTGLEAQADELSLLEEYFHDGKMTGIADALEVEKFIHTLVDHKMTGHYKVLKALGVKKTEIDTGEIYKSGKRKGQPKTVNVRRKTDEADMWEWELQENRYRIFYEQSGFKVDRMKIEAFLRDFKYAPKIEGYELKPIEYIDVARLPNEEVLEYFNIKIDSLKHALANGWSQPCEARERWDDRRCEEFCPVAHLCPHGKEILAKKEALEQHAENVVGVKDTLSDETKKLLNEKMKEEK